MIHTIEQRSASGIVTIVVYDTSAKIVTTSVNGVVTETRPLTSAEQAQFADIEQSQTETTNKDTMVEESDTAVDKLVAVVEALNTLTAMTNAAINQNPAAVIKDLARECKTIARQANREARLTSGRTESTNTGTVVDT